MKWLNSASIIVIIAVLAFFASFQIFLVKIEVGEVGVRTLQYGIPGKKKGVENRDFGPGWHRKIPMIDTWRVFDATVQTQEFTTVAERQQSQQVFQMFYQKGQLRDSLSSQYSGDGPEQIELKSKDGYTVKLDVTIKYRILEGEAHLIYQKFNTEGQYKRIVRDQVQNTLRNVLGTMRTEDFYDPFARREKTGIAFGSLSEELHGNHVELISLLIRDITFDPSYERKILDKKLADQDVELNKSKAQAEEKKGLTNKILAETEAKVRVIAEEQTAEQMNMKAETDRQIASLAGEARVSGSRIKADADLYAAQLMAKGSLLEKEAEANGERLKASALKGDGGANLVAIEAIRGINLEEVTLSTLSTDPLDVNDMISKLGAAKN
jgi:regulator of protease activity HflC (stomatin/prohibitin superfamily)